jgi:hypothetical protein
MNATDASYLNCASKRTPRWELAPDRRQRSERRTGPCRGGRRSLDPPAAPVRAWKLRPARDEWSWMWFAQTLTATFRQVRLTVW